MPKDHLTLQETRGLLRHIEKTTSTVAEALSQYEQFENVQVPLVGVQIRNIIDSMSADIYKVQGVGERNQFSLTAILASVSETASELATEIEQAGKPPVPEPVPPEPEQTADVIEQAAQAAENPPESPQEPSSPDGEVQDKENLRIRPAQRRALYAAAVNGRWIPSNSNERKTANALVAKGLITPVGNSESGYILTAKGQELTKENTSA